MCATEGDQFVHKVQFRKQLRPGDLIMNDKD